MFAGSDVDLYRSVRNNPINFVDPYGLLLGEIVGALHGVFTAGGPGEVIGAAIGGAIGGAIAAPGGPGLVVAGVIAGGIVGGTIGSVFDPLHAGELNPQEDLDMQLLRLRATNAELEEFLNSPEIQEFDRLVDEWNRRTGGDLERRPCQ